MPRAANPYPIAAVRYPGGQEVSAQLLAGINTDSSTAGGNVDVFSGRQAPVQNFTNNLSSGLVVGLNIEGASPQDKFRICRNSASPSANTVIVKSGTAAGGTAIGTLAVSTNGYIEAQFDSASNTWVRIGQSAYA